MNILSCQERKKNERETEVSLLSCHQEKRKKKREKAVKETDDSSERYPRDVKEACLLEFAECVQEFSSSSYPFYGGKTCSQHLLLEVYVHPNHPLQS